MAEGLLVVVLMMNKTGFYKAICINWLSADKFFFQLFQRYIFCFRHFG